MKKSIAGVILMVVIFLVATIGVSFAVSGGAVSEGNISVFKDGKLSRNLTGVNPVDEGSLLVCNGKCMIKSGGISILAEDQAELAIANQNQTFNLFVRSGHVEFIISSSARKIVFHTPAGAYSVADVMFNSSSNPVVRGYMEVDDSGARVGIREGRMIFATADGAKSVKANDQIILALSDVEKPAAQPLQAPAEKLVQKKKATAWWGQGSNAQIATAVIVAGGAISGGVYAATRDHGSSNSHEASPAQ